ncbi:MULTISPECIES: ribokinase [Leuconostoc]|uniref:Ribokinase n=2 Tax=Leuconostoc kimchii TaxID=136609 RepID=D5T1R1_LEUKI|nr:MULTISPECIES: ribokinase [Leuconostoc]ADG40210.1 ribokinase [Leuconostoc kimchii IMSNU 11154]AEJ31849.1 ribokinase [Leuconostoc sp. C2]QBR46722.1 ribokinase [Leuconostoc kimchii]
MKNKVVVIGSLNMDTIQMIDRLPQRGETLAVRNQASTFGGKGANQAVAAARQGADVTFIGAVGNDDRGRAFKQLLVDEGIKTDYIFTKNQPTGSATIMLEDDGHNTIMVFGGANMSLSADDISQARAAIVAADVVVAQLEVPMAAVAKGFEIAREAGVLTILNPAPVTSHLTDEIMLTTDLLIPNETEAAALADVQSTTDSQALEQLTLKLRRLGMAHTIVTLGGDGVYYHVNDQSGQVPIFKVDAVDTTAAGDTFIGTVAANITKEMTDLPTIIKRSCFASSLTVSRRGALVSIPTKAEVDAGLQQYSMVK